MDDPLHSDNDGSVRHKEHSLRRSDATKISRRAAHQPTIKRLLLLKHYNTPALLLNRMSKALEDELGLPENATLSQTPPFLLETTQGSSISISPSTSLHKTSPKCLLVGRQASTADIRIQHGSISRKHALFYYMNGDIVFARFRRKTWHNDQWKTIKGTDRQLHDGDELYFGNVTTSTFIVKAPPRASEPEMKERIQSDRDGNYSTKGRKRTHHHHLERD